MNSKFNLVVAICSAIFFLSGCAPKIDGKNGDTFMNSLKDMHSKLSPEESRQLSWDVANISTYAMTHNDSSFKEVDGKTAKELHARAEEIRRESAQIEAQRKAEQLAATKIGEQAAAKEKAIVDAFSGVITNATMMRRRAENVSWPIDEIAVAIDVKNGTQFPVARFHYTLSIIYGEGSKATPDPSTYTFDTPLLRGESKHIVIKNKPRGNIDDTKDIFLSYRIVDFLSRDLRSLTDAQEKNFSAELQITAIETSAGEYLTINKPY
ncbi:hypothetical protein ACO0LF_29660 [Undibacterium sp. Di27W]|uniref:hypothetical protein n=1 Tax=Undibacterium sp. Di27W TaxID=3413036 RepID=UPI003BF2EAE0